jgi:HTH-type transcriptional regulator/antitoxin HigA
MTTIQNLTPGRATHPGEILADELEARNITQQDIARLLGMQKSQLNEIIKGKRNINAELAILLEKALDIPAHYWLNAQQNYDLDIAKMQKKVQERATALELWKLFQNYVSVNYLKAQKLISGDPVEDIPIIKRLFGVYSVEEIAALRVSPAFKFRKSEKLESDLINLQTWVFLVKYQAKQQIVPPFDQDSRQQVLASIRTIIFKNENVLDSVRHTLNSKGIKVVYQEKAEKTPVDGMSCWSDGNPAIGMTLRYSRIDNFAFTLFHELGHIYLHLGNSNEVCFVDIEIEKQGASKEENEADAFAKECLITKRDWKRFEGSAECFNQDHIKKFAKEISIHPAVVAGRVCHEKNHYKWNRSEIDYSIH